MSRGIVFFAYGQRHLARLVVSLNSLRKHYSGEVAILCNGSEEICGLIGRALGAGVFPIPVEVRRRHTAYCTKPTLHRFSPFNTTLLVDADTTFAGNPQPLIEEACDSGLVVTQFSNWLTNAGKIVSGRILKWRGVKSEGIPVEELIDKSLAESFPAVNTGCIAWDRDLAAKFLVEWEQLTNDGWRCPFSDELSCQLLLRRHLHTMTSCAWNYSALYPHHISKPVIYHQHGAKCTRPEWLPIWMPEFREVWEKNLADVQSWIPEEEKRKYLEHVI